MNLAVLQADFGCHKEAISAMLETVSTARENRDMTCLNFALNWLFHFGRAHPDLVRDLESNSLLGAGKESMAFLRVKAKESGMWTLWSSVLLSEAKLALINGDSVATSLEYVARSSQVIVERNMKGMFGSQLSLFAGLWNRLGLTPLSNLISDIFLRCHARHSVFDDELKHTCRIALTLAERGQYDAGLQRLERLDENSLRSWKPRQYWHKYRGIIKLKKDLHHNNLDGAEELLAQLLQSKSDDLEPDMAFLVDSLHVDCLVRRGDLQAASIRVDGLIFKLQDESKDIALRVKLLLLKVSLLDKCGRPQRAFSTAMRAASLAWRARLIPCLWHAIGALSNILVSLGEFEAAIQLLTAILPRALECESSGLAARLYSYFADASMGLAGNVEPKSTKRTEYVTGALGAVQKAFDHYSAIEDVNRQCEMMAKKAMIMKLTGETALAADYAAAYVELRKSADALSLGGT
ncbi:Anaphase-promoting complex subunit 5 [Tolypocladium paradoxum]|uniref:Anaphase-promoting complex subunit 5 n=1 Tax=Tolypocladium paradoxum TaxID=94208 RepID=A0A2S4KRU1_9HYPO|nr:Anaphase-promoting complex subunit 5 [Tolypocladium paradoxum]